MLALFVFDLVMVGCRDPDLGLMHEPSPRCTSRVTKQPLRTVLLNAHVY